MAIALDRPTLITPGLKPIDPAFESWWVRPGGATVVEVRPGDRVTVRDPDGGQPAEVTVLDAEGGEGGAGGRGCAGRARGGGGVAGVCANIGVRGRWAGGDGGRHSAAGVIG